MTGYEECVKLFRTQDSDKSPEFGKYLGLLKKFVIDPNENAREKALDAVFAFVEEAQVAGKVSVVSCSSLRIEESLSRTVGEVAPGIIGKCLNGRAKMKERAFDVLLMYVGNRETSRYRRRTGQRSRKQTTEDRSSLSGITSTRFIVCDTSIEQRHSLFVAFAFTENSVRKFYRSNPFSNQ